MQSSGREEKVDGRLPGKGANRDQEDTEENQSGYAQKQNGSAQNQNGSAGQPLVHRVLREVLPLLAVDSDCQISFSCPSIYTKLCTNLLISKVHWVGINFYTVQKCTVGSTTRGCTLYNVHRKHMEASIRSRRCLYILARCAVCCQLCQGICRLWLCPNDNRTVI